MLRCKTSSEKEIARGGPVSSAIRTRAAWEMTDNVASVKNEFGTKSSVFALAFVFDTVTARKVLQHG